MIKKYLNNFIFHPFLVGLCPVFFLFNRNHDQLNFQSLIVPSIIMISLTIIFLLILKCIFKDFHKSGIFFSVFWLWFSSYESGRDVFFSFTDSVLVRHRYFMVIWLLLIIVILAALFLIKINFKRTTKYLNIFALLLTLLLFVQLVSQISLKAMKLHQNINKINNASSNFATKGALPDIYFILFDAYTGNNELKRLLNFDNTDISTYLTQKGFYVCKNSRSNYSWSRPSISSILNMDYLPMREDKSKPGQYFLNDSVSYNSLITNNKVLAYVKSIGYKYIDLSTWEDSPILSDYGVNHKSCQYDFILPLLHMSILGKPLVENYFYVKIKREDIFQKIEKLEMIPSFDEPTFVYAHIMIPHEPFVFDDNGGEYSLWTKMFQKDPIKLYLKQLQYTNKLIKRVIDKIINNSQTPPIIIIQGDHGARDLLNDFQKSVQLRMGIFNAYYFPDKDYELLYDTITPVNSYRIIFRKFFLMGLDLLEDRSYYQVRDTKNSRVFLVHPTF